MLFHSIEFAIFTPVVFILYWFFTNKNLKRQNALLLIASYVFYGWWDWRFLSLIAVSSLVDYCVGIGLSRAERQNTRKALLLISICVNIGLLGFFKYFNFFAQSFADAFTLFGASIEPARLNFILPVGISFYTFQTLSYSIDLYKRKLQPTTDILAFFSFVSFFPQLVAGPIERATKLLPQFCKSRTFEYDKAVDGTRQILWGLFKKLVIADNCAVYADKIFANPSDYSGSTLLLGAIFFAFQIYGDFSGYSDIAIGTARLFGFKLMRNFAFPYFSRDVAEFWRRWHISLSTWFRDYVYIPLGGSRCTTLMKIRNTLVLFLVSGFWHGANWTFIAWGALNALYFLPLLLTNRNKKYTDTVAEGNLLPTVRELFQMALTFFITVIAWVFFRSSSLGSAFGYLQGIFSTSLLSISVLELKKLSDGADIIYTVLFVVILIVWEWLQRTKHHPLQFDASCMPTSVRWGLYYGLILAIVLFGRSQQDFIYFQF
jgi:D-alanyl-lipoteichoic acid acyltransferase DltB (MBOAT superfamily)